MSIKRLNKCTVSNTNPFWLHYLSLENSLKDISEYIAIHQENYKVYSFKNMQLYFAVCSEIDSIFKHIRNNIPEYADNSDNNGGYLTIAQHKNMIDKYFKGIKQTEVVLNISGFDLQFQPFSVLFNSYKTKKEKQKQAKDTGEKYDTSSYEGWWEDYNSVKHQRSESFRKANLENLLHSFAALHILNLVYAVSTEPQHIQEYDSILIEAHAIHHYPIFQVKNSGPSRYIGGGGDYYTCRLNNGSIF